MEFENFGQQTNFTEKAFKFCAKKNAEEIESASGKMNNEPQEKTQKHKKKREIVINEDPE